MNTSILKNISDGKYEVFISKNSIEPNIFENFQVAKIPSEILEGACCGVLKPYSFNVEITSQDSLIVNTKYISSSKKPIYKKNEKTFYFKTKTGLSSIDFTYDEMISKGVILQKL